MTGQQLVLNGSQLDRTLGKTQATYAAGPVARCRIGHDQGDDRCGVPFHLL